MAGIKEFAQGSMGGFLPMALASTKRSEDEEGGMPMGGFMPMKPQGFMSAAQKSGAPTTKRKRTGIPTSSDTLF